MGRLKEFIGNALYSIASNALNLVVTAATSLLIPLLLGSNVEQYGYYQIYLFYVAYIGFFHFGLCDGVLLKEGGNEYKNLDKSAYSFQFYFIIFLEVIISFIISGVMFFKGVNADYFFIAIAFGLNLIIYIPRNLLAYILQSTNRIKESSFITIIGRSVYLAGLLILFLLKIPDYKYFIVADLIGKTIALIYVIFRCKDIVFLVPAPLKKGLRKVKEDISVGIKLMLASISSMIITGIVQFAIQTYWSVETYGKISLTLSLTNLILTFISAVAIVLYPTLRRVNDITALELYKHIRSVLMIALMATLLLCYPLQKILICILPQYTDGLSYLPILFPVCIFSAKVSLLVQTYMQVYRMEKQILQINVVGIVVTLLCTCVSVIILKNLTCAVLTILISQAFRSFYAEYILSKKIQMHFNHEFMWETILVLEFVGVSYFIGPMLGLCTYIPLCLIYVVFHRKQVIDSFRYIKSL